MSELDLQKAENEDLKSVVTKENLLKSILVEYVGNKINPADGSVTVEMIVDVLAKEFPEFLMVVAEENFIRGYEQAMQDIETMPEYVKEKN